MGERIGELGGRRVKGNKKGKNRGKGQRQKEERG